MLLIESRLQPGRSSFCPVRPPTHPRYKYDAAVAHGLIDAVHPLPRIGLFFLLSFSRRPGPSLPPSSSSCSISLQLPQDSLSLVSRHTSTLAILSSRLLFPPQSCFRFLSRPFLSLRHFLSRPPFIFLSPPDRFLPCSMATFNLREE